MTAVDTSKERAAAAPADATARLTTARRGLQADRRRRRTRTSVVTLVLVLLSTALVVTALMLGDFPLRFGQVVGVLTGRGDDEVARLVVVEFRGPRLALAVLVGVGLGVSGALFQSVLANPLASPDIIGVSQGASAAAVAALLLGGLTGVALSASALAGGLAVGLFLYAVAWRGGLAGHRFVLSGIGVAYACASVIGYVLTRSDVQEAQAALLWMTGSVAQADWPLVRLLGLSLLVLLPLVALTARRLQVLLLGDQQARALGLRPELVRATVLGLGIALACVATAAAGPVAFVAFTAAPVARRLVGDGGLALVPSALVGLVLVLGADVVAQHVLPSDMSVPVGVVTGAIGGPYLIWLMATRRARTA